MGALCPQGWARLSSARRDEHLHLLDPVDEGRVDPIGADGQHAGDIECADDLAGGSDPNPVAQTRAHQHVVDEQQAFTHRRTDMVAKLHWRGAGATFGSIHHNEVGGNAGLELDNPHELARQTDAQLEADRLA